MKTFSLWLGAVALVSLSACAPRSMESKTTEAKPQTPVAPAQQPVAQAPAPAPTPKAEAPAQAQPQAKVQTDAQAQPQVQPPKQSTLSLPPGTQIFVTAQGQMGQVSRQLAPSAFHVVLSDGRFVSLGSQDFETETQSFNTEVCGTTRPLKAAMTVSLQDGRLARINRVFSAGSVEITPLVSRVGAQRLAGPMNLLLEGERTFVSAKMVRGVEVNCINDLCVGTQGKFGGQMPVNELGYTGKPLAIVTRVMCDGVVTAYELVERTTQWGPAYSEVIRPSVQGFVGTKKAAVK